MNATLVMIIPYIQRFKSMLCHVYVTIWLIKAIIGILSSENNTNIGFIINEIPSIFLLWKINEIIKGYFSAGGFAG